MSFTDYTTGSYPQNSGGIACGQGYRRYRLFIWTLPVFFIAPLALFSVYEWWSFPGQLHPMGPEANALNPELVMAWSALVQGICWGGFALFACIAYARRKAAIMWLGYGIFLGSIILQFQLVELVNWAHQAL